MRQIPRFRQNVFLVSIVVVIEVCGVCDRRYCTTTGRCSRTTTRRQRGVSCSLMFASHGSLTSTTPTSSDFASSSSKRSLPLISSGTLTFSPSSMLRLRDTYLWWRFQSPGTKITHIVVLTATVSLSYVPLFNLSTVFYNRLEKVTISAALALEVTRPSHQLFSSVVTGDP